MEQIKQYEYVDLGLPSGLKWAKCNVGAEKETDYGYYFQWGEIEPHDADTPYDWANAPFNNGSSSYNSSYFDSVKDTVCPNNILAKEYDTATQIVGGNWRIPTDPEFEELLNNTTNKWVTNFNGSGVNGIKFTSKANGNSIFIPAAGYYRDGGLTNVGFDGNVWTSSLRRNSTDYAYTLFFNSSFINADDYDYYGLSYRCNGLPVRGVCE